jgi:hypothetical protein
MRGYDHLPRAPCNERLEPVRCLALKAWMEMTFWLVDRIDTRSFRSERWSGRLGHDAASDQAFDLTRIGTGLLG